MHEVITNNLDLWTSVLLTKSTAGRGSNGKQEAYGITKLRELILELAVRGKLVPQDPNDEPASLLLERLAQEKARLMTEGKLRKQQPLPDIAADEIPIEIPANWEWVRLGNIGEIFNGNSISERVKEAKYTNIDGGLPFIATKDVGYGWIVKSILLSHAKEAISQASLNQGQISSLPVPLPPKAEQHRIVAKVDELMTLCDALKENLSDAQATQIHFADAIVEQAVA